MKQKDLICIERLLSENVLLRKYLNWNYDIAPEVVQSMMGNIKDLPDWIDNILNHIISQLKEDDNYQDGSWEDVYETNIIDFVWIISRKLDKVKIGNGVKLPLFNRIEEWAIYYDNLISISQKRLAALYVYGNHDTFNWPSNDLDYSSSSRNESDQEENGYGGDGHDSYGNYDSGYDSDNPWTEVFGYGDEARAAYWNTQ